MSKKKLKEALKRSLYREELSRIEMEFALRQIAKLKKELVGVGVDKHGSSALEPVTQWTPVDDGPITCATGDGAELHIHADGFRLELFEYVFYLKSNLRICRKVEEQPQ